MNNIFHTPILFILPLDTFAASQLARGALHHTYVVCYFVVALLNDYLSQNEGDKLDPEHSTQQEMRSPGAEEELEMDEDSNDAVLQNCFAAIVDTLAHSNPQ